MSLTVAGLSRPFEINDDSNVVSRPYIELKSRELD